MAKRTAEYDLAKVVWGADGEGMVGVYVDVVPGKGRSDYGVGVVKRSRRLNQADRLGELPFALTADAAGMSRDDLVRLRDRLDAVLAGEDAGA